MFTKKKTCGVCGYRAKPTKEAIYIAEEPRGFMEALTKPTTRFNAMDCPRCGGDVENAIIYADEENKEYFVYCPICGIETVETYASKAKALKAFADGKTKPISGKEAGGGE